MEHPNVREWVVTVSHELGDPLVFGPYTKRKARELRDGFNEQIERGAFEGEGWLFATVRRISNPMNVSAMLKGFGKKPVKAAA